MNLLASPWGIYAFAAFRGKNNKCTTNRGGEWRTFFESPLYLEQLPASLWKQNKLQVCDILQRRKSLACVAADPRTRLNYLYSYTEGLERLRRRQ